MVRLLVSMTEKTGEIPLIPLQVSLSWDTNFLLPVPCCWAQ